LGIYTSDDNAHLLTWKRVISLLFLLSLHAVILAQAPTVSNLRKKTLQVKPGSQQVDSLSIVPGTLRVEGIPDSLYRLDPVNGRIQWLGSPGRDSVQLVYRTFPYRLNAPAQRMRFDTVMGKFVVTPLTGRRVDDKAGSMFDFGNINYNGSFGRGLSFGNRQDVVVNSSLNMQLNGYIGDSILLTAAITDNNIPIQPDGTTQNLNEFDKVFLQFSKDRWKLSVGDIDIRQGQDYFLNFYKRLQGGSFETGNRISKTVDNKLLVSAAVAKGKFTRNVFNGSEGNQGPYRLRGANNEQFFIILAGTERVYIDGQPMQRGEDQDYVINYNTAEIRFTPKQMITKDKRIQVEFEYADRNYLNAQIYLRDEVAVGNKLKLRVGYYTNNDAKNSPINQTLDTRQKQYLADIGDSVQNAFYPSAVIDTFAANKILYRKVDTLVSSTRHDSVYVYSPVASDTLYSLSFIDAGDGRGDYVQDLSSNANGKVFLWVSPDTTTGVRKGRYVPAIYLVTPKKQQVLTFGGDYQVTKETLVRAEMGMSVYDVNTFSSKDKGNDRGLAGRVMVNNLHPLHGKGALKLQTDLSYEYVQDKFRPIERLRNVEFNRDWGLAYDAPAATENLITGGVGLLGKSGQSLKYTITSYTRSNGYRGMRNSIQHQGEWGAWRFNNYLHYTSIDDVLQKGYFLRPNIDVARKFKKLGGYTAGFQYSMERNLLGYKASDSLNLNSFSFDTWKLYFRSPDIKPNKWGVSYFQRSDQYPLGKDLVRADRSGNLNVYTELLASEHHQFRLNATYRKLNILDPRFTNLKADQTLLGRAEYLANVWKGGVTGNPLYELGTGQEPRRNFSYLEVPAGQGEYTWIDYNNDGIQQLNEFELAKFQDQAKFIRVFTPTSDFIKANYLTFNYSFTFNPRGAIAPSKAKQGLNKLFTRLYLQSTLQINRKKIADGIGSFNPFHNALSDTTLLTLDQLLSNSFSFNKFSTSWGMDLNNIRSSGRAFLSYGYETRRVNDWNLRARVNATKRLAFDVIGRRFITELLTPTFSNRNYHIDGRSVEPRTSYIKGTTFRAQLGVKYDVRDNTGGEHSEIRSVIGELKYNVLSNTSLSTRFTYSGIKYNATANSSVSYIMLDGLLPGKNYLWTVDLTKRLTGFLEVNIQYEGRKAGTSGMVHIGRAQLRALF